MINMTIEQALKLTGIDLREAEELLAFVLGKSRAFVKAHACDVLDEKDQKKFLRLARRREKHAPMAYLLGYQPFCGYDFKVNKHVLIPRPETEQLVEFITGDIKEHSKRRGTSDAGRATIIVDIGTGSGCIACSLKKKFPDTTVIASDISPEALSVVKHNCKKLSTDIKVIHSNLLDKKLIKEISNTLDVRPSDFRPPTLYIVANLPYLPSPDAKTIQKDVVDYEPHQALFAGRDGLKLIKRLLKQIANSELHPSLKLRAAGRTLNSDNCLLSANKQKTSDFPTSDVRLHIWLEVDPRQITPLSEYAKKILPGVKIKVYKDSFGRKRFVSCSM